MAAVATPTDLFVEPTEEHPTWLTPAAFLSTDFSPSAYASSLRSFVPLETLASGLRSHQTTLESDLVDLINRDYADFVGLRTKLAGAGDAASRIGNPLAELRAKEVAALRVANVSELGELRALMERRAAAAASRELLERMLDTFHVISKVC